MEYVVLAAIIVFVIGITIGIIFFIRFHKSQKNESYAVIHESPNADITDTLPNQLTIAVEQLPVEAVKDESKLMQITDSKVLSVVNQVLPDLMSVGSSLGNAVEESTTVLYQAIIPKGAKLAESKDMAGAFRGFYHGEDGIASHANLLPVDQSKAVLADVTASAMDFASMVVGQYYMSQINAELSQIHDGIEKIADFQDHEFKSKILALTVQAQRSTMLQAEILGDQSKRNNEIVKLNALEQESMELLGQANLTIGDYAQKTELDYSQYEIGLIEMQKWCSYQEILLELLFKFSELRTTLSFGKHIEDQNDIALHTYLSQAKQARESLAAWNDDIIKQLKIDVTTARRKRVGIDGAIHWLPGLVNEDLKFKDISERTIQMIEKQTAFTLPKQNSRSFDMFAEDVRLIAKDGKLYYYPQLSE